MWRGSSAITIGGPPLCAMKLVKPEVSASAPLAAAPGGAASACGGNFRFQARKTSVTRPVSPPTHCGDSTPKPIQPSTMPIRPAGSSWRSTARSAWRPSVISPMTSDTHSSGSTSAAACGTVTLIASSGVASAPIPEAKPDLEMPTSSAAGTATA